MFEIGFPELLVIAAITLVVVGPEKIPQVIKTVSKFLRRLRLYFENIKQEIEKEIDTDEIRAQIHNHNIMDSLDETQKKISDTVQQVTDLKNDSDYSLESEPMKNQRDENS
ncbi:MAG: twin-arginine translocase subunit TatB [Gammaproteobacteria bacterium]|nr:twin-arginine translocase subunit TatB [Gammaproteobacteria bacterium]|tara:strand:+ start:395 stop:727 length:333 start_codon:yes stop_codon:yes gene_type:complete